MATNDDVRRIALSLPETTQSDHFNAPSFRVNKKLFAVLRESDRVTIKLDPDDQHNLVHGHPGVIEPVSGKGRRVAAPLVLAGLSFELMCATKRCSQTCYAWRGPGSRPKGCWTQRNGQ